MSGKSASASSPKSVPSRCVGTKSRKECVDHAPTRGRKCAWRKRTESTKPYCRLGSKVSTRKRRPNLSLYSYVPEKDAAPMELTIVGTPYELVEQFSQYLLSEVPSIDFDLDALLKHVFKVTRKTAPIAGLEVASPAGGRLHVWIGPRNMDLDASSWLEFASQHVDWIHGSS